MVLVILAAAFVAAFAVLFRSFARYGVPLMPAIAVNYACAFAAGCLFYPPTTEAFATGLWKPACVLGILFVSVFTLNGISAQRMGSARTTIAGRMSLVLTVVCTMWIFHERIGLLTWAGIALALFGLLLITGTGEENGNSQWHLPVLILLGSAACDIGVNVAQRLYTTALTESTFTTFCFGAASVACSVLLIARGQLTQLADKRVWIGGGLLGLVNYGSLLLLIVALGAGDPPASTIFPLMNIASILFGTAAGVLLFRERLHMRQWSGLGCCVLALLLILLGSA